MSIPGCNFTIFRIILYIYISLESGIVPDKLKIAKVIPLLKSGERTRIVISTLHLYVNSYCKYIYIYIYIFCIR